MMALKKAKFDRRIVDANFRNLYRNRDAIITKRVNRKYGKNPTGRQIGAEINKVDNEIARRLRKSGSVDSRGRRIVTKSDFIKNDHKLTKIKPIPLSKTRKRRL